jgi:hypothetical protein
MISDNQMDEFFNDCLRDYSSSVPADMWDRIVEKKKKDRMIWLFFSRLFAFVILALGLIGGYFIFNQKKLSLNAATASAKINHVPLFTDSIKANLSNPPSVQDQLRLEQINDADKKIDQKEKTRINNLGEVEPAKVNGSEKFSSSQTTDTSKSLSTTTDSNSIKENKKEHNNDSLRTKQFVKSPAPDSSRDRDLKKPEAEKKLNNGKWFLDLYASPDYPIISPRENEQAKLSFTLGIKLNRLFGKHFSVKTGIQFSQVNIGGDDSLTSGNTIHLLRLDLPILAGYSLGNENLKTTFNGGAVLNLYSWLRGSNLPDFFKTNTGLSLYLGVNFERKINARISLFTEPYYRYQLTSMTISSISNMKFIDIAGISFGARYYIKNRHSRQ